MGSGLGFSERVLRRMLEVSIGNSNTPSCPAYVSVGFRLNGVFQSRRPDAHKHKPPNPQTPEPQTPAP